MHQTQPSNSVDSDNSDLSNITDDLNLASAIYDDLHKKDDTDELLSFIKKHKLDDIKDHILDAKLNIMQYQHISIQDIDDLCTTWKLTISQKLRFKAAIQSLSSPSHTKNDTSIIHDIPDELEQFYTTTQTITFIGGSRVGKSSIKDVIMGRKFDENHFPTIRMKENPELYISKLKRNKAILKYIQKINVQNQANNNKTKKDKSDDLKIKYKIWDCPGQKALENIPILYITGAMAVLIVYDITDAVTFKRAQEWMEYVSNEGKGYDKVMVIGNKKDLDDKREISYEVANNTCMEYGFNYIETSAKTGTNINTLQKWLDSHTGNKVQNKIKEYQEQKSKNKDLDWSSQKISLSSPVSDKKDDNACCDFW